MSRICVNNSRRAALSILLSHSWTSLSLCRTFPFQKQSENISAATARRYTAFALNAKRILPDNIVDESLSTDSKPQDSKKLKSDFRALLRNIAQPVAVVTSFHPFDPAIVSEPFGMHGATLSSFTSIAMDPYPLVAFSLRIPSRMASVLTTLSQTDSALASDKAHMVINFLAASQASASVAFSRPDLHPYPLSGPGNNKGIEYTLSEEVLPILDDVVGAISCRLVSGPIPLYDLNHLENSTKGKGLRNSLDPEAVMPGLWRGEVASELFIARVVRVEEVWRDPKRKVEDDAEQTLPLVYHRRGYTTCYPKS